MKTCPSCHTVNAPTSNFCKQCGQTLPEAKPPEATVRWSGQQLLAVQRVPGGVPVASLFLSKDRLVIGRAADCDICLPHPMVSRYHALLEKTPEDLRLRDLGSVNGVWVGGKRVTDPVPIPDGERVGIGPFLFTLKDGVIRSIDSSRSLRLEARGLEKVVPIEGGQTKKLLDNINLVVNPGEFVSLLGPSGSGKSTLMDCLNGRRRATGGKVLANGEDFYQHFDNFRQSLGYVPQKDIVHTQLTVYRALYYTAKLRLPTDTGPAELSARIEAVIREMELDSHRHTLVANLSGGQIKRVSLGAELLAQPCMLYIDEATSGLDAGTEARMMRLFRRLSDEGRSIICITHNVDNVEQCHLILILARGKLIFYGPPAEALVYFQVGKITEIYDRVAARDLIEWEKQFAGSELHQEFVDRRLAAPPGEPMPAVPVPVLLAPPAPDLQTAETTPAPVTLPALAPAEETPPATGGTGLAERFRALTARALRFRELFVPVKNTWHQFRVLTSRYVTLVLGDQRGLRLLLLQAPIVAVFLLLGFLDKDFQSTVPRARKLKEHERKMLHALEVFGDLVNRKAEPNPSEQAALDKIRVEMPVGEQGEKLRVTGRQFLKFWQALQILPLNDNDKKKLEVIRMEFDDGTVLTAADLAEVMRQMHDTGLIAKLRSFNGALVPEEDMINPRYTYMLLFILVMIVMWFGCNNAAKEIVKEEAIYGRERAVNLGILPYLSSKFLVLSLITIFHALLLMLLLFGTLQLLHWYDPSQHSVPSSEQMLAYLPQFGVLALLAMTGVALGLLLSACVATPDRANALLPYVLIPQMILGGGFLAVGSGVLYYLAVTLSPVYWAYRAIHLGAHTLPDFFPGYINYPDNVWLPCQALTIQTVVLLLLTAWFLRRKDA